MAEQTAGHLPDRWLNCPKIGALVADLFVPFKTPLDERHRKQIERRELRWEPNDVLGLCEARDIKLGLVIDLTNSKRYYKPEAFKSKNIGYRKIACRGHDETPGRNAMAEFIKVCHEFFEANPDRIIGVHCTHGFNRTGYLICAYLVQMLQWSVGAAVSTFQKAREPGIYKQDYLVEFATFYGEAEDVPEAAPRPTWENAPVTQSDDIERKMRSKDFMSGISRVHFVDSAAETTEIQQMAAEMAGFRGSRFPGSQPVSMDSDNLANLKEEHHVVSWKADGTRYMMVIAGKDRVYFLDRDNAVFKVNGIIFPRRKQPQEHLKCTLLDGEMVIDVDHGRNVPRYLIYDIVFFEKFRIRESPFALRVQCINLEITGARRNAHEQGLINIDNEPFRVRIKQFYDVTVTEKFFGEKFRSQISHEVDGLIFQPSQKPYKPDRCHYILKWKPPELNTIDFRLKIVVTQSEGSLRETVGLLYVGGFDRNFAALGKMTREDRKLNGKIVECCFQQWIDKKTNQPKFGWVILRERTDKSFPNGYKTAEGVMKSISKPITKDMLFSFIKEHAVSDMEWHIPPNERKSHQPERFLFPAVAPSRPKQPRLDE